ncbi:hypothetical protein [Micromonospora sp. DT47]|uniref:hypothetical protein n=1 Tax=Micromonospora sp. DT47 TaxID=3393431 RepID=UPI003CFA2B19
MSSSVAHVADSRPPRLGRLLAAHVAVSGAFVTTVALYLGRMVTAGVGPAEMVTGAYDPKDLVPFGMSGANPFAWLYLAVSLLYLSGVVLGPALALYTAAVLMRERDRLPRRARILLLTATVATLALTVLRFTPILDDLHQWWLD